LQEWVESCHLSLPPLAIRKSGYRCSSAKRRRSADAPLVELLPLEAARGFLRLPEPDPADLFFDLEGDPLHEGGLEYLWGVHFRDAAGEKQFVHRWGHNREDERAAFEAIVDWFTTHVAEHPKAHIYHYAAYEVSVLRRLSTAFASREDEVDALLRAEKFVDLYAVSRAAIRTSERDMSLKTLEHFFAPKREEDVKAAGESIVQYHRWMECGDHAILDGILAYNRVDCENTEGLRNWLLSLRPSHLPWWEKGAEQPLSEKKAAERDEREALREAVRQAVEASPHLNADLRELLVQLVDFHKRAKKPAQWAVFDRCETEPHELVDDLECIGCVAPSGVACLIQTQLRAGTYLDYAAAALDHFVAQLPDPRATPVTGTAPRLGKPQHALGRRTARDRGSLPTAGPFVPHKLVRSTSTPAAPDRRGRGQRLSAGHSGSVQINCRHHTPVRGGLEASQHALRQCLEPSLARCWSASHDHVLSCGSGECCFHALGPRVLHPWPDAKRRTWAMAAVRRGSSVWSKTIVSGSTAPAEHCASW
jgi:hypothetical protein